MKRIAIIGDFNQNEKSHVLIMESIKEVAEEMRTAKKMARNVRMR